MLGRLSLLLALLAAALGGCAAASEERLAKMEADIAYLQNQEIRLAILEDTVNKIVSETQAQKQTQPQGATHAPRRVEPSPVKTTPPPAPSAAGEKPVPANLVPARSEAAKPEPAKPRSVTPAPAKPRPAKSSARAPQEYQAALARLEAGNPTTAIGLFKDFIAAYPAHSLTPNAGYWLGECYYTLKQYDSAIIAFKDVVAQYPSHDKAAAAMLKAGYSYLQLSDKPNARFYLEALLKDYPASKPAALARERLAAL